jgi:hypothetical protein
LCLHTVELCPPPVSPLSTQTNTTTPLASQSARLLSQLRVRALSLCDLTVAACDALDNFLARALAPDGPDLAMDCVGKEVEEAAVATRNMKAYLSLAAAMTCPVGEDEAGLLAAVGSGVGALTRAIEGAARCTSAHVEQRVGVARALLTLRQRFLARDVPGLSAALAGVAGGAPVVVSVAGTRCSSVCVCVCVWCVSVAAGRRARVCMLPP